MLYYSWLRDFLEAGKARLRGDSLRNATQSSVEELKEENVLLKVVEWVGGSDPVLEKSLNM